MAERKISIAIIGGGASGTIAAIQLLRKLSVSAKIFLVEKREEGAFRGAAYSGTLPYEPLNVTASRMSIYNHLPDDFYNWLKENKQPKAEIEITKDSFVSRRWFGDYLTESVNRNALLAKHAELEVINGEATDIDFDPKLNCYSISLSNQSKIGVDYLIFATGNELPFDILAKYEAELGDNYIANPWSVDILPMLKRNDTILILGTGLTMVDYVVSLKKIAHSGKIFCLSRNGYLPLQHADTQDFVFDLQDEPQTIRDLLKEVKKRIKVAADKGIAWQNVLDAMRPRTARLWKNLDTKSKKYFLNRVKVYWEIHRHRMPAASANAIKELRASGQLNFVSGNITAVQKNGDNINLTYTPKGELGKKVIEANVVINCTGPLSDYYKCENTLIKNLLNKGWMQQDELKIGIKTGVRGEIITANGVVLNNAFCVGPLRKAMEWESTAVREIRTHAENVAFHIAGKAEKNYEMEVEIGL